VISSLFLSLTSTDGSGNITDRVWFRILVLLLGLAGLWILTYSKWLDRKLSQVIEYLLSRYTDIEVRDYAGLLHLTGNYVVGEMTVRDDDWLAGRKLIEMRLSEEGILVLGIERTDGTYIGAPRGHNTLEVGDVLLLYGQAEALRNLDERRTGSEGNWEHFKAVDRQKKLESEVRKLDEQRQGEQEGSEAELPAED
jgi:K+/H+ antiporter YhaU regulatory subunit KhtT